MTVIFSDKGGKSVLVLQFSHVFWQRGEKMSYRAMKKQLKMVHLNTQLNILAVYMLR